MDAACWLAPALVMPVAARGERFGIVACGEPLLGRGPEPQIVGSTRSAHLRRNPARVDGVAIDVLPKPGDCHCEGRDEELAVGVGASRTATAPALWTPEARSVTSSPRGARG